MLNQEEIQSLAEAVAERLALKLSMTDDRLWDAEDVAKYIGAAKRVVLERYATSGNFPAPIQLPSEGGRGRMRWKPSDIRAWADRQKVA